MKTIIRYVFVLCVLSSCSRNPDKPVVAPDPFTNASQQTGVNKRDLQTIAMIESSGRGSCDGGGLLQVKTGARKQMNKLYHTNVDQHTINTDANTNALFGARYLDYVIRQLKKRGYKTPTFAQQYIAYQQGLGGFCSLKKTLKNAPNTKITKCQFDNLPGKVRGTTYSECTATQRQYYNYWNRRVKNVQAKVAVCSKSD